MLFIPALYLFLGHQAAVAPPRWQSSYSRIFQQTTGNNGYEEFVRAADLLRTPENGVYEQYEYFLLKSPEDRAKTPTEDRPMVPKGIDPSMTLLDVQREHVRRCAVVIDMIAKGNMKPVADPRAQLTAESVFPELSGFKNLARFAVIDMHVQFADGQPNRATDAAITILQMRSRLPNLMLISDLVGDAMDAIILAGVNENAEHFSERDWAKLEAISNDRLKSTSFLDSMRSEMQFELSNIPIMLKANPDQRGLFGVSDDSPDRALFMAVAALSPTQKERLAGRIAQRVRERFEQIFDRLKGPEAHWADLPEEPEIALSNDPESLVDGLAGLVSPVFNQAAAASVKNRTQMRLLRLHARIQRYRWHIGHLPTKLEEAASTDAIDPLTNQPFIYEPIIGGYRLASKGIALTGEIEMKYKRSGAATSDGPTPPLVMR